MSDAPLLLYDGHCALCNGWVKAVLRFDPAGSLRFAPLAGATARQVLSAHPELAGIDSLIYVADGRATTRSTAVFAILAYLGWPWKALVVFRLIPREIRDSLYDVVAFWRFRLFGRYDACPLPPAGQQARFLP